MGGPLCRQQGYALIELAVALLIGSLLAAWGAQALVNRYRDAQAQAAAVWMAAVHKAVGAYVRRHGPDIQSAESADTLVIDGFADWRSPTLAELVEAGLLSPGVAHGTALTGAARITVWRDGSCPGAVCAVEALIHGERPLIDPVHRDPDQAMIAQWLLAAEGKGAAVQPADPASMRGAAFAFDSTLPNGDVLPVGTVGMAVTAEHLALWNYLRVRDPRDPDFQGALSVKGDISGRANASVDGQLVVGAVHEEGMPCEPDNAIAHDLPGGLLVCKDGLWRSASRSGGGAYGYHSIYGCQTAEGTSTANPITGSCACPWYATAVLIMEMGPNLYPDGKQYAYLCVG